MGCSNPTLGIVFHVRLPVTEYPKCVRFSPPLSPCVAVILISGSWNRASLSGFLQDGSSRRAELIVDF